MQDLTEAVLSAARGVGWEQMRKIDLAALMESLCTDLDEMGEPVTWQPHSAAPFSCRPNEIRRAVRNLIENAIAYGKTARKSACRQTAQSYEIMVDDDGPGIPEADRNARVRTVRAARSLAQRRNRRHRAWPDPGQSHRRRPRRHHRLENRAGRPAGALSLPREAATT